MKATIRGMAFSFSKVNPKRESESTCHHENRRELLFHHFLDVFLWVCEALWQATLEATSIQGVVDPVFRRAIDKEKQRRLRCQDHKNRITQTYFSGIWSFKPFLGIHVKLPGSANKEPSSITDVAILWSAIRFHNLPLLWTSMLFYTCSLVFLLFLTTWLVVSLIIFKCWGHLLRLSKSRTGKSSCCRISQVYPSDKKTRGKNLTLTRPSAQIGWL